MELPSKLSEQIVFNTALKFEEQILIVMEKSTHEEKLSEPLHTKCKQFKIAVTFLTVYNGTFNVTFRNDKFYLTRSINDDELGKIPIAPGTYEYESLNSETKGNIIEEGQFTETNYTFTIESISSTLGSIIESPSKITASQFAFTTDDSIRDLFGIQTRHKARRNNLPAYPKKNLSIDDIFF